MTLYHLRWGLQSPINNSTFSTWSNILQFYILQVFTQTIKIYIENDKVSVSPPVCSSLVSNMREIHVFSSTCLRDPPKRKGSKHENQRCQRGMKEKKNLNTPFHYTLSGQPLNTRPLTTLLCTRTHTLHATFPPRPLSRPFEGTH